MVINGKAAMQIMGDWAKGEFTAAGQQAGQDFVCVPAPGTANDFTFNIDSFVMFKLRDPGQQEAQKVLARLIIEPTFQAAFNLNKGSIPVRADVSMDPFDECAKLSRKDFDTAAKTGALVPSMAHGMATTPDVQGAFFDVVTNYFNSSDMTAQQAADRLAKAVKAAR